MLSDVINNIFKSISSREQDKKFAVTFKDIDKTFLTFFASKKVFLLSKK